MSDTAFCGFCEWQGPTELILGHLRAVHDIDAEPETWPDGRVVIIDETLEPGDFSDEAKR